MTKESGSHSELDDLSSDEKMLVYSAIDQVAFRHPVSPEVVTFVVKDLPVDLQAITRREIHKRRST